MKEITKEITKYISDDGKEFSSKESCEKHEKRYRKELECAKKFESCSNSLSKIVEEIKSICNNQKFKGACKYCPLYKTDEDYNCKLCLLDHFEF